MNLRKRYDQYMYSYPHKSAYDPLEAGVVEDAWNLWNDDELSLYIHIPFCSGKCGYCNLFSVVSAKDEIRSRYIDAVCRQMIQYGQILKHKQIKIKQVILGGGTPFILTIGEFQQLFQALEQQFSVRLEKCRFDIETSPNETTEEKLEYLKQRGMHRLSIGIQSFQDEELNRIYRHHTVSSCHKALTAIKKINPDSLNIDLIYGIQGQTVASLRESLKTAMLYEPNELFLYPLYIRKDTLMYGRVETDAELQYELYQSAEEFLRSEGYIQTSMRRFVKKRPEKETSCGFESMLSFGCGGRSYMGNLHVCEPYEVNSEACYELLEQYIMKENFMEGLKGYILNQDEQMRRFVIKNLGYDRGISLQESQQYFGTQLLTEFEIIWRELNDSGLIRIDQDRIALTPKGMGESDRILAMWISDEVNKGMNR